MKPRKFTFALILALAALLFLGSTVLAAASPEGALIAAFNTLGNAFDTLTWLVPNDVASMHAAPALGVFEYRINLWNPDQVFCDNQVLGTWITWIFWGEELDGDFIENSWNEITLDGQPLELQRTALKRAWPTFHDPEFDFKFWFYSEGVPVLGTLEAGTHDLSFRSSLPGADSDITFEVIPCGE